jgi:glycosyltransferase involved in cell wall biosynthesis
VTHDDPAAPPRIALFLSSLAVGGSQRVLANLASGFARRGVRVDLVLATGGDAFRDQLDPEVSVVDLGATRVATSLPRLVRYLRRIRPAALLSTQLHANLVALLAVRLSGVATRIAVRQGNVMSPPGAGVRARLLALLARRQYRRADALVAVSAGVADDMAQRLGIARDRVRVLYNPVVNAALLESARAEVGHAWFAAGAPPVVLSVGRLSPQKDFPTLIRAFAELRNQQPARLVILGEGRERRALEALIAELGLVDLVWMPGSVANPHAYVSRAALYVLCSRWEGLPNALIEALAIGTPAIATDCVAGPREVLEGGRHGALVPPGDVGELALQMRRVLLIPAGEREAVDSRALERFSFDLRVDDYLRLLRGDDD